MKKDGTETLTGRRRVWFTSTRWRKNRMRHEHQTQGSFTLIIPCSLSKESRPPHSLPKSLQSKAKSKLHQIWQSASKDEAEGHFNDFVNTYEAKYPKAAQCLEKDRNALLTFYDFPAEHWRHIRTTNPIESTFATVRLRTNKVRGCFSANTIMTMAFKLCQCAQKRWIRLHRPERLADVVKGVKFVNGIKEKRVAA